MSVCEANFYLIASIYVQIVTTYILRECITYRNFKLINRT